MRVRTSAPVVGSSSSTERGPVEQRDGRVQPAALAARQLRRAPVEQRLEPEGSRQLVDAGRGLRAAQAGEPREEPEVVAYAQREVHARVLRRDAEPGADLARRAHRVDAAHLDPSVVRTPEPGDDRHERRLPRAVGPEQAEDGAGLDPEIDAVERDGGAVRLAHALHEQRRSRAPGQYAGSDVPVRILHTDEYL